MIRRILIPLDPSPYTETAIELGCRIARLTNAELTGLVVLDIPGIEKSIGPVPAGGLHYADKIEKVKENEARERIHNLLENFKTQCREKGVNFREAEVQGSPSESIINESIYYDAVMIGLRTHFNFETSDEAGDSLGDLLDHTITPVYGVPEKLQLPDILENKVKVLIAFDGSFPAARALQRFAQLGRPDLFEVLLLAADPEKETANYYLNQAEAYLNTHEFSNVRKEWTSKRIIQAMEEKYLDWAHVVVVGAHSKKGVFDFMIGSLTKYLIKTAKKPLLIGQ